MDEEIWGLDDIFARVKNEDSNQDEDIWLLDEENVSDSEEESVVEIHDDDLKPALGELQMLCLKPSDVGHAFVYTTKLDDMAVFNRNVQCKSVAELTKRVELESKPLFRGYIKERIILNSTINYEEIKSKIDEYNKGDQRNDEYFAVKRAFQDSKLHQFPVVLLEDIQQQNKFIKINTKLYLDPSNDMHDENNMSVTLHPLGSKNTQEPKEFVDFNKALEINYCCWYNRQKNLMEIHDGIITMSQLRFMTSLHECLPGQCKCCCYDASDPNMIPMLNVETKNKALTHCTIPYKNNQTLKPTLMKDKEKNNDNVMLIKNTDEVIEVYQAGEQYCVVNSSEINTFGLENTTCQVACCWYKREFIINHSNVETPTRNLARRPHECSSKQCVCCCKYIFSIPKCETSKFENDVHNQTSKCIQLKVDTILKQSFDNNKTNDKIIKSTSAVVSGEINIQKKETTKKCTKKAKKKQEPEKSHKPPKLIHVIRNNKLVKTVFQSVAVSKVQKVQDKSLIKRLHSYRLQKKLDSDNSIGTQIKPQIEFSSPTEFSVQPPNKLIITESNIGRKTMLNSEKPSKNNQQDNTSYKRVHDANIETPSSPQIVNRNLQLLPNQLFNLNENLLSVTCDYYIDVNENGNIDAKLKYPLEEFSLEKLQSMSGQMSSLKRHNMRPGKYYFTPKINIHNSTISADPVVTELATKIISVKKKRYSEALKSYKFIKSYAPKARKEHVSTMKNDSIFYLSQENNEPPPHKIPARTFEEEFLTNVLAKPNCNPVMRKIYEENEKKRKHLSKLPGPSPKIRVLTPSDLDSIPIFNVADSQTPVLIPVENSESYNMSQKPINAEVTPVNSNIELNNDPMSLLQPRRKESPLLKMLLVSPHWVPEKLQNYTPAITNNTNQNVDLIDIIEID